MVPRHTEADVHADAEAFQATFPKADAAASSILPAGTGR
jgi:hypothetical protein